MLRQHWRLAAMLAAGCTAPGSQAPSGGTPAPISLSTPSQTEAGPGPAAPRTVTPAPGDAGLALTPGTTPEPRLVLPEPGGSAAAQGIRAPQNDAPPSPMLPKPFVPPPKLDSRGRGKANRVDPYNPPVGTTPPLGPSYGNAPATDH